MADYEDKENSLITERDIDPEFGLFSEEAETENIQTAEQELQDAYTPPQLWSDSDSSVEEETDLESVPDADDISQNSPVDPASPPETFHGTDLINGVGNDPEEETESD